jgi:hypothetical protein
VDQPEYFPEMVGILDTEDFFALGMAGTALLEAGIVYDVVEIPDFPSSDGTSEKPKWWTSPCRIMVAVEDADEARLIVEPYLQPLPNSELDSTD